MPLSTSPPLKANQRFGMWTVLHDQQFNFTKTVKCQCDCGTIRDVNTTNLRRGHSLSCGCTAKAALAAQGTKQRKNIINPGDKFHRLTVVDATRYAKVLCQCDCGNTAVVTANALYRNMTKSCGCYNRELARAMGASKHSQDRMSSHPLYNVWQRLMQNKKPMHETWAKSAKRFIEDVEAEIGPRPPEKWFQLRDKNQPYQPGNIWWGPRILHRSQRVMLTHQQKLQVVERIKAGAVQYKLAEELQVSPSTISSIWRSRTYNP